MEPSRRNEHRWEVVLSDEALEWMTTCTTDQAALGRVMSDFNLIWQTVTVAGPLTGEPKIKKLISTDSIWEARVKDPTGAYRMFFAFGRMPDGRRIAAIAYGRKKSEQVLPRSVLETAERKVKQLLAELGAELIRR